MGTAKPIKAIGPQNAVTVPVKIAVMEIHKKRTFFMLTPSDIASLSPITRVFNGFVIRKERMTAKKIMSVIPNN